MSANHDQIDRLRAGLNIRSILLELLLAEISGTAGSGPYRGFLTAMGRRMAHEIQLPPTVGFKNLEPCINEVWRDIDAGSAKITIKADGIAIDHALPTGLESAGRSLLPDAFIAIIESCYDEWFRVLGSGDHIRTQRTAQTHDSVSFWHGV